MTNRIDVNDTDYIYIDELKPRNVAALSIEKYTGKAPEGIMLTVVNDKRSAHVQMFKSEVADLIQALADEAGILVNITQP